MRIFVIFCCLMVLRTFKSIVGVRCCLVILRCPGVHVGARGRRVSASRWYVLVSVGAGCPLPVWVWVSDSAAVPRVLAVNVVCLQDGVVRLCVFVSAGPNSPLGGVPPSGIFTPYGAFQLQLKLLEVCFCFLFGGGPGPQSGQAGAYLTRNPSRSYSFRPGLR